MVTTLKILMLLQICGVCEQSLDSLFTQPDKTTLPGSVITKQNANRTLC